MSHNYAPVVIFGYNRVDKLRKCIEALKECDGIGHTEIFLYIDGPKDRIDENAVNKVKEYTCKLKDQSWFLNLKIKYQDRNRGLAESVMTGITEIINQYGKVIVLEDDIIVTSDFLLFMNGALDAFQNDGKVWSISTNTLSNHKIKACHEDILWTYRGECWGWASWADRWNKVDWEVSDYNEFINNKKCQRVFNHGGRDMTQLLQMQHDGKINSWAIRWCYQQYKENMITVFSKYPKSYNIGLDGSGTNCGGEETSLPEIKLEKKWIFKYSMKDKTLLRYFRQKYFISYWRQKIGSYWYALTEEEHYLVCRKGDKVFFNIKAGVWKDYENPMICEIQGEIYIFATIINKITLQKKIIFFNITKSEEKKQRQLSISHKESREFRSVLCVKGRYYLLSVDYENNLYVFYQMGQDMYSWTEYAVLGRTENLVNTVVASINDRIYLSGSLLEREDGNTAAFVEYEIENFLNPERMKLILRGKEAAYSFSSIHAGNWFYREGKWYRPVQKSTYQQREKSVIVEEIMENPENGVLTKMQEEITVNSAECVLRAFIYRKLGVAAYSCMDEYDVTELLVQHFSLGRLVVKILRNIASA